jgi:hypothetical protein
VKYPPVTEFSAERCEILARVIEQQPHTTPDDADGFSMNAVRHTCGSPCCITGFANSMLADRLPIPNSDSAVIRRLFWRRSAIEQFLGCTREEAASLHNGSFSMQHGWPNLGDITPAEAAAALRALAAERQGAQQ